MKFKFAINFKVENGSRFNQCGSRFFAEIILFLKCRGGRQLCKPLFYARKTDFLLPFGGLAATAFGPADKAVKIVY